MKQNLRKKRLRRIEECCLREPLALLRESA